MTPHVPSHPAPVSPPGGPIPSGLVYVDCAMTAAASSSTSAPPSRPGRRRETVIDGKRVKTIDIHAHCAVPKALELMGHKLGGLGLRVEGVALALGRDLAPSGDVLDVLGKRVN